MADRDKRHQHSMTKNTAGTSYDGEDLNKHNVPPTAAVPAGTGDYDDGRAALSHLSTRELKERAEQLAIKNAGKMLRDELVEALIGYRNAVVRPATVGEERI